MRSQAQRVVVDSFGAARNSQKSRVDAVEPNAGARDAVTDAACGPRSTSTIPRRTSPTTKSETRLSCCCCSRFRWRYDAVSRSRSTGNQLSSEYSAVCLYLCVQVSPTGRRRRRVCQLVDSLAQLQCRRNLFHQSGRRAITKNVAVSGAPTADCCCCRCRGTNEVSSRASAKVR